ncbi:MAG: hypothetical protein ACRDXX_07800 [Stackebrandtia sp.]
MNEVVDIEKSDVQYFARQAKEIGEALETASGRIVEPAEEVELSGWTSAEALTSVAATWKNKTEALTQGAGGLFKFGSALKQFAVDVDALDADNADKIDSVHEASAKLGKLDDAFEGEYEPKAPA